MSAAEVAVFCWVWVGLWSGGGARGICRWEEMVEIDELVVLSLVSCSVKRCGWESIVMPGVLLLACDGYVMWVMGASGAGLGLGM